MNHCLNCQQKEKQFKILQADLQFEMKKMRQDLASEKVTLELHHQKEYKKVIEKYNKEKQQREQENKKWIQKYDNTVQLHQKRMDQLQIDLSKKKKEFEQELAKQYQKRNQEFIKTHHSQQKQKQRQHSLQVQQLKSKFASEIQQVNKERKLEMEDLTNKHQQQVRQMVRDYDYKIHKLKEEVSTVLSKSEQIKLQNHQKQTLLYQELYYKKQQIDGLMYNVDQLQRNIRMIQEEIRLKQLQISALKQKQQQQINELHQSFRKEKDRIISEFSMQIQSILKDKLDDCQKYEQVVKEIEGKRQNQIKLYESNLKEVKEFVEERPSRDEDIEQINVLKELLNQKERECQKAYNDAKGYQLQLNNKEEVFNKIFCHSPLNIQKLGKRRDTKNARASSSTLKDISKYQSINLYNSPNTADQPKKQKLALQPKSTKYF